MVINSTKSLFKKQEDKPLKTYNSNVDNKNVYQITVYGYDADTISRIIFLKQRHGDNGPISDKEIELAPNKLINPELLYEMLTNIKTLKEVKDK